MVLQANEASFFAEKSGKEPQRPKTSCNSVLVEGEVEQPTLTIGLLLLNHLFCFGCLTMEVRMDKFMRKIITTQRILLKPYRVIQQENKGYNDHHA